MRTIRGVVSGAALSLYRSQELLSLVIEAPAGLGHVNIGGAPRPDTTTPRDVSHVVGRQLDITLDDAGNIVGIALAGS